MFAFNKITINIKINHSIKILKYDEKHMRRKNSIGNDP